MSEETEVAVTSDGSGQLWNTCVWSPVSGAPLLTFKNGVSAPRTLSLLALDHLMAADRSKPLIQLWGYGQTDQQQRAICPGRVGAMAAAPNAAYAAVAIQEKIHVWQLATGRVVNVLTHHYQPVRVVRFTDCGSHFVSGGEDGLIVVWCVADATPRHVWDHHTLAVTDVYVGYGGVKGRIVTASLDQTCKVYSITMGQLLLSVIFNAPLTSVVLNRCDSCVVVGTSTGGILEFDMQTPPRTIEHHYTASEKCGYAGHTKAVTCLAVSSDGALLLSGSDDMTARVWDTYSRQCLRVLSHKGPVTNAMFAPGYATGNHHQRVCLPSKLRMAESGNDEAVVDILIQKPKTVKRRHNHAAVGQGVSGAGDQKHKQVNKELYKFYVAKLLQPCKASVTGK